LVDLDQETTALGSSRETDRIGILLQARLSSRFPSRRKFRPLTDPLLTCYLGILPGDTAELQQTGAVEIQDFI
jgi:hypothetical protein